jgi:glucose uptake protein GlcU
MTVAVILFAIAALFGVIMALIRFSGRDYPPAALAVIHGLFAAAGLIALLLVAFAPGVAAPIKLALVLFLVAAIGGFVLIYFHAKRRALPLPLVVIHGLVAVIAFLILLVGIINRA